VRCGSGEREEGPRAVPQGRVLHRLPPAVRQERQTLRRGGCQHARPQPRAARVPRDDPRQARLLRKADGRNGERGAPDAGARREAPGRPADGHADPRRRQLPPRRRDRAIRVARRGEEGSGVEQQPAGGWEEARGQPVGEVRSRRVDGANRRRVLRSADEQVRVELRVAALPLALVVGVGLGIILGLEYTHVTLDKARDHSHTIDRSLPFLFGLLRGMVFGLAGGLLIDAPFGLLFGLLSGAGLMTVYAFRLSPSDAYQPDVKPRLRARELIASAMRGTATALAGIIAALLTHGGNGAFGFALAFGIVAGSVSAIVSVFSPFVEWWADHLPARRLGALGTVILLLGLVLQSIQYWVVLLNVVVQ